MIRTVLIIITHFFIFPLMNICVLISCMHQADHSIVERTGVQTNCVVVNQCDNDRVEDYTFVNKKGETCHVCFVNTTERGLSRSRNMAIAHAPSDAICLVCDDDEVLADDYVALISGAYEQFPEADVMTFQMNRCGGNKPYPTRPMRVGFIQILKTSSVEITFRKQSVSAHAICFDTLLGSGTGNGAGEENKFLLDCRRKRLSLRYFPAIITTINDGESQWFKGYDRRYFENHGWSMRRVMGGPLSLLYIAYDVVKHRKLYAAVSPFNAFCYQLKGWSQKRVSSE